MKTYVITLSEVFPATHKRRGENTYFRQAFLTGITCARCKTQNPAMCMGECYTGFRKIHTIRANYRLWAKRIADVQRGEAVLSVRQWSGRPYMSKQTTIATLTADDGVGLQQLTDIDTNAYCFYPCVRIDTRDIDKVLVANNDGLSLDDWRSWFKDYDISKPLAIIHFTSFRY